MEDFFHECTCLADIRIFQRMTSVDHTSQVATVERDEIFRRFFGIVQFSAVPPLPTTEGTTPVVAPSKCKNAKSCFNLPDVVLSCASCIFVRPKTSPKECGRRLRHFADSFEPRTQAVKVTQADGSMHKVHVNYITVLLEHLYNMSVKIWTLLKR